MDLGGFQSLIERERREVGGHGLADAGGPDEKDIMRTGGGDFEGTFDRCLAFDIGEVEFVVGTVGEQIPEIDVQRVEVGLAFEKRDGLAEVADEDNLKAYLDGPIIAQWRQHPGIRNVSFRRSPILQSSTRQTR